MPPPFCCFKVCLLLLLHGVGAKQTCFLEWRERTGSPTLFSLLPTPSGSNDLITYLVPGTLRASRHPLRWQAHLETHEPCPHPQPPGPPVLAASSLEALPLLGSQPGHVYFSGFHCLWQEHTHPGGQARPGVTSEGLQEAQRGRHRLGGHSLARWRPRVPGSRDSTGWRRRSTQTPGAAPGLTPPLPPGGGHRGDPRSSPGTRPPLPPGGGHRGDPRSRPGTRPPLPLGGGHRLHAAMGGAELRLRPLVLGWGCRWEWLPWGGGCLGLVQRSRHWTGVVAAWPVDVPDAPAPRPPRWRPCDVRLPRSTQTCMKRPQRATLLTTKGWWGGSGGDGGDW